MKIRAAELGDAEGIRTIYNHAVETSTAVFDIEPRSIEAQQQWLTDRSGAHAVVIADIDGQVAGFASLSPYRPRPAYLTTVESSVYVHDDHHGQGIGTQLYEELSQVAVRHGFHTMMAWIADGNEASIALHTKSGFELVGTQRQVGRKFGRWLDVTIMQKLL